MKLLMIGSGGREHALAWRLARSPRVHKVYVAPGGTAPARRADGKHRAHQCQELADFVQREGIALTVVGPEAPLAGVVDVFRARPEDLRPAGGRAGWKARRTRQGLHGPPQHPDGALRDLHRPARSTSTRRAPPSSSRPTAWPPAKGVVVAATLEEPTRRSTPCWATAPWARPARVVIENACRRGSQLHRHVRQPQRAGAGHQPGPRLQDGDQGLTPAAWAPIRPPHRHAELPPPHHARDHPADRAGA